MADTFFAELLSPHSIAAVRDTHARLHAHNIQRAMLKHTTYLLVAACFYLWGLSELSGFVLQIAACFLMPA